LTMPTCANLSDSDPNHTLQPRLWAQALCRRAWQRRQVRTLSSTPYPLRRCRDPSDHNNRRHLLHWRIFVLSSS
jgi:hypothetical protein